ncbi:hypothetical protein ANANG_G00289230 [Anguilla anguilla]|uniref:PX domain-containing protein n=1 Tax=Anguilla anguilla TaxID=7936 RepID=A0A9D3LPH7_ANGAN|nr:hypothetical protein ANANG_G00289230 [Anguilla anguilla]
MSAHKGTQPCVYLRENSILARQAEAGGAETTRCALGMESARESPLLVARSLTQLLERDTVRVELIPEKKGLFLKHVEYQVTSQRFKISVYRRYTDFDVLHEVLLHRFPYRAVPALPPKRKLKGVLTSEREFIEGRRRALRRFINTVARHPFFSEDELVKTFLTFNGSDVQCKLREAYKKTGDEFMTNKISTQAKDFLPTDVQGQFASSRELIRNIFSSFHKLRGRVERVCERSRETSADLQVFGKELSTMGSGTSSVPSPAGGHCSWGTIQQSLKGLSGEFALLADKAAEQGRREEDEVVEKLNLFLDVLQSYKDLCERHEKGILQDQQRAQQRHSVMRRQTISSGPQAREQPTVEQLESRIVQQENAIQAMELRSYFSLFCLHQETQLVFAYLQLAPLVLEALVGSQILGHREMGELWNNLQPKMSRLLGDSNSVSSPPFTSQ